MSRIRLTPSMPWLIAFAGMALLAGSIRAQNPPPRVPGAPDAITQKVFDSSATAIPFLPLGDSPLALTGPSRPASDRGYVRGKTHAIRTIGIGLSAR